MHKWHAAIINFIFCAFATSGCSHLCGADWRPARGSGRCQAAAPWDQREARPPPHAAETQQTLHSSVLNARRHNVLINTPYFHTSFKVNAMPCQIFYAFVSQTFKLPVLSYLYSAWCTLYLLLVFHIAFYSGSLASGALVWPCHGCCYAFLCLYFVYSLEHAALN